MSSATKDIGIVWFVDENSAQRERFYKSYETACYHMPRINKVVFYTGSPTGVDSQEIFSNTNSKIFAAKFDAWEASPFQTTLFLDNDTFVLRDMTEIIKANQYVTALPYPNLHRKASIPNLRNAQIPDSWRNINSGVVIFSKEFIQDYEKVWLDFGQYALSLPGKDQCLFSLCLATCGKPWTPLVNLQITTTPYAVEFIRRCRGVPQSPSLGRVPLSLILDAYVFHYTADKELYRDLFMKTFNLDQMHKNTYTYKTIDDYNSVSQDGLYHGKLFAECDLKSAPMKRSRFRGRWLHRQLVKLTRRFLPAGPF